MRDVTRRDMLKLVAGLAAGGVGSSVLGCRAGERPSPGSGSGSVRAGTGRPVVVVARDPKVATDWDVDEARLRALLDRAMCALGDTPDAREVWRFFFDPKDVVGLKVNALAGIPGSTHSELAIAAADALTSAGVDEKNVLIWDRTGTDLKRAGYVLNGVGGGYRCFGTDARGIGYESEHAFFGKVGSRLSRILSSLCTGQINVPAMKDHGLAGISGALKNTFGAIHNPNKYHANHCDPWVADVNALAVVRAKSRLVICDALYPQCHGGPGFKERWAWNFGGLVLGTDPVAVDRVLNSIIEARREELGLKTLEEEGRPPLWLETAADEHHRLGVSSLEKVERMDV